MSMALGPILGTSSLPLSMFDLLEASLVAVHVRQLVDLGPLPEWDRLNHPAYLSHFHARDTNSHTQTFNGPRQRPEVLCNGLDTGLESPRGRRLGEPAQAPATMHPPAPR